MVVLSLFGRAPHLSWPLGCCGLVPLPHTDQYVQGPTWHELCSNLISVVTCELRFVQPGPPHILFKDAHLGAAALTYPDCCGFLYP